VVESRYPGLGREKLGIDATGPAGHAFLLRQAGSRRPCRGRKRGAVSVEPNFDAFYAATSRRSVGYLYAMTGNLAEAEDAVQEAYARAWQRWSKVREYDDPEAWIRTVAYRIRVSSWRKAVNRLHAHDREASREDAEGLSPDHLALVAALRRIPAEQSRVIVLHHLVGLSVEEIAHEIGSPTGTVKARLARGRRALAPYVNEFADDGSKDTETGPGGEVRRNARQP
jgi:RNA polymerase sigma-70 factor, ECF subfamily